MKVFRSVAALSVFSLVGSLGLASVSGSDAASAQTTTQNKQIEELVEYCMPETQLDVRFQCLFEQTNRLNQAKNFARQRGEQENGGVSLVETEPSMHGPSAESPHELQIDGDITRYTFTYRLRPRATANYTQETQVVATYNQQTNQWAIDTVYNQPITPTSCSYADQRAGSCS